MGKYLSAVIQGILVYVLAYATQWMVALTLNSSPAVILFVSIVLTTGIAACLGWYVSQKRRRRASRSPNEAGQNLPRVNPQQS